MSSIKVNQCKLRIRTMFEQHLDLHDLPASDKEREHKILSRCLAAFCVYHLSGCKEAEAGASVWDGSGDNGIDAAFFDRSESRVIFVQAKWIQRGTGQPEAKDIRTFVSGIKAAIDLNDANFDSRLFGKFAEIAHHLETIGTKVHLVIVSTGSSSLSDPSLSVLNTCLDELNGEGAEPLTSFEVLGLEAVYQGLVNDPLLGSISIEAPLQKWSRISEPYEAYFGVIEGITLKQWWRKFGKRIVSANIRHSLGDTEVNNEIRLTAQQRPDLFWYFNNGITIVAEEAKRAPSHAASRTAGMFEFHGASIVNGAQTISSLSKVEDDDLLARVQVSIRVILTQNAPNEFRGEVTRTTNLQNRIEQRDFVIQDPEQKRLRDEMIMEDVTYQIVRSEDAMKSPNTCDLLEVTTALACASGDANLAVQVKTGIGRFFNVLDKPPYTAIFNPSLSGARAFNATRVLRLIEEWIDRTKKALPKKQKKGPNWGTLVHGNRILAAAVFARLGESPLNQPIEQFDVNAYAKPVGEICELVFNKMTAIIESKFSGKFLAVLFKNPTMCKQIYEHTTTLK